MPAADAAWDVNLPSSFDLRRPGRDGLGRAIIALAATLYVFFAIITIAELVSRRDQALEQAARRAASQNYLLAEHLRSIVASIDASLRQLAAFSQQVGGAQADASVWSPVLASLIVSLPGVSSLSVTSADGIVRHSTVAAAVGRSQADSDLDAILRRSPGAGLVTGAPMRASTSQRIVIPLGYRLDTPQGDFAGTVIATLDPDRLRDIYRVVDTGALGFIVIVHPNGTVILRHPADTRQLPEQLTGGALLDGLKGTRGSGVIMGRLTPQGRERITAFRMLGNLKLLVATSLTRADTLRGLYIDGLVRAALLVALGLAVFLGGRSLVHQAAARARSEQAVALRERQLMDAQRIADMASLRFAGPAFAAPVSERARSFFGWDEARTSVTVDDLAQCLVDVDAEAFRREIAACRTPNDRFELDLRFGSPLNPARLVRVEGSWEPGEPGIGDGVMAVFQEATQARRTEVRLRHIERLEAVGRLTGGVAHDFNNMMTVILGSVDQLLEEDKVDPRAWRQAVEEIERAATRAADLTQQLLAFARRQPLHPQRVDINDLVRTSGGMLGRVLGRHVELRLALSPDQCRAMVDPGQVETALVNLCVNARDAMPSGGVVTITSAVVEIDAAYVRDNLDAVAGRYVLLSVADTGAGIAADQLPFVFEPFFSTKDVGDGTGLGLAMVHGFVNQSGGHVRIESEVGRGTVVYLYLPEMSETPAVSAVAPELALPRGAGETILLVEDEDLVREAVARQLVDLGYDVIAVGDSSAALAALASRPQISLMLTDAILASGLNGRELAERALSVRPDVPVVYMSGYSENVIVRHGRLEPTVRVLLKPFRKQELGDMIRRALDEPLTIPGQ
jgi:signal transduction histidine kinase